MRFADESVRLLVRVVESAIDWQPAGQPFTPETAAQAYRLWSEIADEIEQYLRDNGYGDLL